MPLDEPSWWYDAPQRPANSVIRLLLSPFAVVYGAVAGRRMLRQANARVSIPVVCIGNYTAGGTGKTPLALLIADLLRDLGEKPVFLSRGYGGTTPGPHQVDAITDLVSEVGDEPLLLATAGPTVIARDRAAGAQFIVEHDLGSVIIMDDGLQNPSVAKDLNIAVVDRERGIGNGHVIPAGPLRAPLVQQLGITDAIVVSGQALIDDAPRQPTTANLPAPLRNFGGPSFDVTIRPTGDLDWITSVPILAFAGIGNPDRFLHLLSSLGGDVRERRVFRDHHMFREAELAQLLADAERLGLQIVTTEKDYVRLDTRSAIANQVKETCKVLGIRAHLAPDALSRLRHLLEGVVSQPLRSA